jgi:hypothetical protein
VAEAWAGEWGLGLVAREAAAGIKTGFKTIIFPLLKYQERDFTFCSII